MSHLAGHGLTPPRIENAAAASSPVPQPRLVRAAHEFEAAMMKELMAPLEPGHDLLGGDGGEEEGSSSALSSFAGEALGKAISEHGGLGIAKSILHQLAGTGNHSGNSPVPEMPVGRTVNPGFK